MESAVMEVERYGDVASMASAADSVVRGAVTDVVNGRTFGGDTSPLTVSTAVLLVRVNKTLRGEAPVLNDQGLLQLEVMLPVGSAAEAPAAVASYKAKSNSAPLVLFLRHKRSEAQAAKAPAGRVEAETGWYRLVTSRGVVASDHGRATAALVKGGSADPLAREIGRHDMRSLEGVASGRQ
jgi:hypothetical protein